VAVLPAAPKGTLRAGAARIEITPPADAALPMSGYGNRKEGHRGIHDPLFVRTIVADDGATQAAIVALDLSAVSQTLWERLSARLAREIGIPRDHILLAATHTHGGPALGSLTDDDKGGRRGAYVADLQERILKSVLQAKAGLQPAKMGFGLGKAYVNSNRRARMSGGGWWLGYNPDGPTDKTVAVVKFENLRGEPLALFINYGVHGTVLSGQNLMITGDLPGATSRYVEGELGGDAVAAWTSGAAGDQNPIYRGQTGFGQMEALGRILGEEVLRVAKSVRTSPVARIRGGQSVVTCAGRKATGGGGRRPDLKYEFADTGPVDIRLSLLMLNHVAFAGVSGEVLTNIGQRLKRESPFAATMMVTHCNGSSGYLPDDTAYEILSYETVVTRVKPGCAENAIVRGLTDLMDRM
jgi:hypothetical protein